jgi:hypothetical protein
VTTAPPMAFVLLGYVMPFYSRNISCWLPGQRKRPHALAVEATVARWQLMIALTLSVPAEDWFTP